MNYAASAIFGLIRHVVFPQIRRISCGHPNPLRRACPKTIAFPDCWREIAATCAAERELQTFVQLAAGLDDNFTVYLCVWKTIP
jgi:hypothetical protein